MIPTDEQLKDILETAVNGGINYWATVSYKNYKKEFGSVVIYETGDLADGFPLSRYVITLDKMKENAITYMSWAKDNLLLGLINYEDWDNFDAWDVDVFIQYILFKEVKYG